MKLSRLLAALCLLPALALARPHVPIWDAAQITAHCDSFMKRAAKTVRTMEARRTPAGIFGEWNRLQDRFPAAL